MLDIYCGSNALKTLQEHGFKQELFTTMLGASGGPKWFSLFGLDKYLFGEYFKDRSTELNLVGSSAGAFRFAALSQKDPVAAITRLATLYSQTTYSEKANSEEITNKAVALLEQVLGADGRTEIINNPIFKAHFIVAKCRGLTSFERKAPLLSGLIASMVFNQVDRGLLAKQYQRYVYHHPNSQLKISDNFNFNTQYQALNTENLAPSLLASGSIPIVMRGIKDIAGSANGMYRDGGIIDYHFDVDITPSAGLTLYPHFSPTPKAGWFDKNLARKVNSDYYKNTVMLVPSEKFITQLPFGKIPDRKDFTDLDASTRLTYWQKVLQQSDDLAEEFSNLVANNNRDNLKAIACA
ncbi:MAG: patatin-like phospholipase family protein [Cognaticolwellia sp.]